MMIGKRKVKRQSYGSVARKRLADVTNSPARPGFGCEARSLQVSATADDYTNQLFQENMALSRVLEERNKVIELNVAELQKLRAMNQKMQMQNWSLAQSNSQILAELKFGRERMKTLQHELVCKEVLLKVKDMEIQKTVFDSNMRVVAMEVRLHDPKSIVWLNFMACYLFRKAQGNIPEIVPPEVAKDPEDADKSYNHVRKQAMKSQSMVAINSRNQHVVKETVEPKRHCMRRHSEKFGIQEQEVIVCTQRRSERSSLGRPSRRAAEKVQSYREAPLNKKMRRSS